MPDWQSIDTDPPKDGTPYRVRSLAFPDAMIVEWVENGQVRVWGYPQPANKAQYRYGLWDAWSLLSDDERREFESHRHL